MHLLFPSREGRLLFWVVLLFALILSRPCSSVVAFRRRGSCTWEMAATESRRRLRLHTMALDYNLILLQQLILSLNFLPSVE